MMTYAEAKDNVASTWFKKHVRGVELNVPIRWKSVRPYMTVTELDQLSDEAAALAIASARDDEQEKQKQALNAAYECMEYLVDILNGMYAVEQEYEEYTTPRFETVRTALGIKN